MKARPHFGFGLGKGGTMGRFSQLFRIPLVWAVLSSVWATATSTVPRLCACLLALHLSIALQSAQATTISFSVTNVSGNTWAYAYVVQNDTLVSEIDEFTILFDLGLYQNLTLAGAPPGWDSLVVQPDPGIPDDGFYDALALMGGIAVGAALGGFSVQVDFLGVGTPGSQPFTVVDPVTFSVLDSGITQSVANVPEASSLALLTAGCLALVGLRQRRLIRRTNVLGVKR